MGRLILAIETSIKNGSLALLDGEREIGGWIGGDETARSADLLPQIRRLFEENKIQLGDLQAIAVSLGPGSFTGLRVGLATAQGLCRAGNIPLTGIGILEALAETLHNAEERGAAVAAGSRNSFFYQIFERHKGHLTALTEPAVGVAAEVAQVCDVYNIRHLAAEFVAAGIFENAGVAANFSIAVPESSAARIIGIKAVRNFALGFAERELSPYYLSEAVASRR